MSKKKLHIHRVMKTKHKKDLVKIKRIISVSIGFDTMTILYEGNNIKRRDEIENSTQGCEYAYIRKHSILVHKDMLDQEETRIHWRQFRRSRNGDYNLEWSPKFMGIFHSRDLF